MLASSVSPETLHHIQISLLVPPTLDEGQKPKCVEILVPKLDSLLSAVISAMHQPGVSQLYFNACGGVHQRRVVAAFAS